MKKSQLLTCVAFLTFLPLVDGMNITCPKAAIGQVETQSKLITMSAYIAYYARSLIPFSGEQLNDENMRLTTISQLDDLLNTIINYVIHEIDLSQPVFYGDRECNSENGRYLFDRAKKAQEEALTHAKGGFTPKICCQRGLEHFAKHVAYALGTITDGNADAKNHGISDWSGTFVDIVKTIDAYPELKQNIDLIIGFNKSRSFTSEAKQQIDLIAVYKILYFLLINSRKVYYGKYNWKINGETVYSELFQDGNDTAKAKYAGKKFETECFSLLFECPCLYGVRDLIKFSYLFVPCHYATEMMVDNETINLPAKIASIYPVSAESAPYKFKKASVSELENISINLQPNFQDDKSSSDKEEHDDIVLSIHTEETKICNETVQALELTEHKCNSSRTKKKNGRLTGKHSEQKPSGKTGKKQNVSGKGQLKPEKLSIGKKKEEVIENSIENGKEKNSGMQFLFKDQEIKVTKIKIDLTSQKQINYAVEESMANDKHIPLICNDKYVYLIQRNGYMDSQFEEFINKYKKTVESEKRNANVKFIIEKLQGDINVNIQYLKKFCKDQKLILGQGEIDKCKTDIEQSAAKEFGLYLDYLDRWFQAYTTNDFSYNSISKYLKAAIKYYNVDTAIQKVESKKKVLRILKDEKYSSKLEYIETLLLNALKNIYDITSNQYVLSQLVAMMSYLDKYYVSEQDNFASAILSYILENDCGLLFLNLLQEIANNYNKNRKLTITEAIDIFFEPFSHFIIVTSSKSSSSAIISKYGEKIKRLITEETLIKNDIEDKKKGYLDEFEKKFNEAKTNAFEKDAFYLEDQFKEFKKLFLEHYNLFNNTDATDRIKMPLQIKDGITCAMFYGNRTELKESMEYLQNIINKYKNISLKLSGGLKRLLISVEECIAKKNKLNDSFFMDEVYALYTTLHEEQVRYDPMIYKLLNLESDIICLSNIINSNALSEYNEKSTYELKQEVESFQSVETTDILDVLNKFYEIMPHIMRVCNLISNSNIMDVSEMLDDIETINKCDEAKKVLSTILSGKNIDLGKQTVSKIKTIISYLDKVIKLSVLQQLKYQYDSPYKQLDIQPYLQIDNVYKYHLYSMFQELGNQLSNGCSDLHWKKEQIDQDLYMIAKIIIRMHDIAMIDHYQIRAIMLSQLADDIKESGYYDVSDAQTQVIVVDSPSLFLVKPDMVSKVLQNACYALWLIARGSENEGKDDRIKQFSEIIGPINKYFGKNLKEVNEQGCKNELNDMVKTLYKVSSLENIQTEIDNFKKELTREDTVTKDIIASCSFVMQKITNYINGLKLAAEDKEILDMEMKINFMNQLENVRNSAAVLLAEFK